MTVDTHEEDLVVPEEEVLRRRGPGPRTQRHRQERRRTRRKVIRNALVAALAAAAAAYGAGFIDLPALPKRTRIGAPPPAAEVLQETWLLIGTRESDPANDANWISVVSYDRKTGSAFMMYIPRSTIVEIPGHGPETVDKALSLGGVPLLMNTTSNLLGAGFDHFLELSDQSTQALFDKFGGVTIDVDEKLTQAGDDGKTRVVFSEGTQPLNGKRAAEFIAFVAADGEEISRGARHAKLWEAIFKRFREDPRAGSLGKLMATSTDLFTTDATADEIEEFFDALPKAKERIQETLPVSAKGVDAGIQLYGPERADIDRIVAKYLAASRPDGSGRTGRRIQILNGNGSPGIGEDVSKRLVPKGFRVVLDSNAKSFDYDVTQILIYSDSKASMAIAEELRAALGVGEILISRQKQSVVDATIVVGKDYLQKAGG